MGSPETTIRDLLAYLSIMNSVIRGISSGKIQPFFLSAIRWTNPGISASVYVFSLVSLLLSWHS